MDHDLAPAIELVCQEVSECNVETAVWLDRKSQRIWNHRLTRSDYEGVRDRTNYTLPKRAQQMSRKSIWLPIRYRL